MLLKYVSDHTGNPEWTLKFFLPLNLMTLKNKTTPKSNKTKQNKKAKKIPAYFP